MYLNSVGSELVIPELGDIVSLKSPNDDDFKFLANSCAVVAIGNDNSFVDISNLFNGWRTSVSLNELYFIRRFQPINGEGYYANNKTHPKRGDLIVLNEGVLVGIPENRLPRLTVEDTLDDPTWVVGAEGFLNRNLTITHLYNLIERKEHVYQL